MASAGLHSFFSSNFATLSPLKPRKVCISPTSFQWRARQSHHHQYSTSHKEARLLATAAKRPFSRGGGLCRDSGSSIGGSLSYNSPAEHIDENNWNRELAVPKPRRSTGVDGAAVVDRVAIGKQVRKLMRSVPQAVAIITSTDISAGIPLFRGATISSFNTVTIEPAAIVSLNIKLPSSTFEAIESSGYFLVHLLSADQTTSKLAQLFTKGSSTSPFEKLEKLSQVKIPELLGQAVTTDAGPPLIENYPSPGHLLCRHLAQKTVELGDHVVIFGTVDKVTRKVPSLKESDKSCLAYANGQYGCVSPLELSSAPKISSAAFDDFIVKLRLMDHICLRTLILSDAHLDPLGPGLTASYRTLRSTSRDLFEFLTRNEMLNPRSRSFSSGLDKCPLSSVSNSILKAITFYEIFLASLRPTKAAIFKSALLPLEAVEAFRRYQAIIYETNEEMLAIRDLIQRLHDPETHYQPPVSDVYSLKNVAAAGLQDNLCYLESYIRYCLPPLAFPGKITPRMRLLKSLLTQYNAKLKEMLYWMYYRAYWLDDILALPPNLAHAQARAAIMRIRQQDILLSWVEQPAKRPQRLQNIEAEFQGLDDEMLLRLRQYGELCEITATYLKSYKAFLNVSELYNCKGGELGLCEEDIPARMVQNTVPRKWFGRDIIRPKFHMTKSAPLMRPYIRSNGAGNIRRVSDPLVARTAVVGSSPNEPHEDKIKANFMSPFARRAEIARRQEESI